MHFFLVGRVHVRVFNQQIVKSSCSTLLGADDQEIRQSAAGASEDGLEAGNAWYVLVHWTRSGGMGVGFWLRVSASGIHREGESLSGSKKKGERVKLPGSVLPKVLLPLNQVFLSGKEETVCWLMVHQR